LPLSSQTNAQLIEELIGSTLASIVKTQGMVASQIAEIVETLGFEPAQPNQPLRTRTFSFEFVRSEVVEGTDEIRRKKVTATLPLLSIVNLPSLAIDEADIQLSLRLVAHDDAAPQSTPRTMKLETSKLARLPQPRQMFVVAEKLSPVSTGSNGNGAQRNTSMNVSIKLKQQPFPLGLDRLQALLEDSSEQDEQDAIAR
jgi:hypothetical protein